MTVYDRQNLPLSPLKVVKKSMPSLFGSLAFGGVLLLVVMMIFLLLEPWVASLLIGAGVALTVLAMLWTLGYHYLYYKLYYYKFDQEGGVVRKGVVSRGEGHVRYERLQNIYVDQDVLDRLLGLYDVHYETAGELSHHYSHVDGLRREGADKLVEFLKQKAKSKSPIARPQAGPPPQEQKGSPPMSPPSGPSPSDAPLYSRANVPISPASVISLSVSMTCLLVFGLLLLAMFFGMDIFRGGKTILWLRGIGIALLLIPLYFCIDYRNFRFQLWSDQGDVHHKVIGQSTTYFYYDRIQNVNLSQGVFDRLFGIYTLQIETASGGIGTSVIVIPGLERKDAEKLRDFLVTQAKDYQERL